jgi:hypothetical protein
MQDQNLHLLKVVTADAGPWAATAARARQPAAPGDVAIPGTGRGWPATQGRTHRRSTGRRLSSPAASPDPASARAGETPRRQRVPQRHAGRSAAARRVRCGTGLAGISCCPAAHVKKPFTSASSLFQVEAATRGPAGSNRRQ